MIDTGIELREETEGAGQDKKTAFSSISIVACEYTICSETWETQRIPVSYHRMYYIEGGEAYYDVDGNQRRLWPGHLYLFPTNNISYRLTHNPRDPLRVLWCHFMLIPDFVDGIIDMDIQTTEGLPEIISLWSSLANRLEQSAPEIEFCVMILLHSIKRNRGFRFQNDFMTELQRYLLNHLSEDLNVSSLAKAFNYDRSYFSRKFFALYHSTPSAFVTSIRMVRAAQLLKMGVSVHDAAFAVGYADKKAFSRAFRNWFGVPPSDYMRSHILQP